MSPEVQEELGLTEKQVTQIKRLAASMDRKRRELFADNGGQGADPRARMAAMNGLQREVESTISRTLNKRQKDRLAQLDLQREGTLALARKEIAAKVKLTSAQSKKIKAIVDEMRASMARTMPRPPGGPGGPPARGSQRSGRERPAGDAAAPDGANPGGEPPEEAEGGADRPAPEAAPLAEQGAPAVGVGDPDRGNAGGGRPRGAGGPPGGRPNFDSPEFRAQFAKMREAQEKIRATATSKIDKLLTPEQKAAYEKQLGRPFDFSKIGPGGPGGGPPGPSSKGRGRPPAES